MSFDPELFPQITTPNGCITVACSQIRMMTTIHAKDSYQDWYLFDSGCRVYEVPRRFASVSEGFVVTMPFEATIEIVSLGDVPTAVIDMGRNTMFIIAPQNGSRQRLLRCFSRALLREFILMRCENQGIAPEPILQQLKL